MTPDQNRGALDFETSNWVTPVSCCLAWGPPSDRQTEFMGTRKRGRWQPLDLNAVLDQLVLVAELDGVRTWWAHNGGRFDWLFLVHAAAKRGWPVTGHCAAGRAIYLCVTAPTVKLHLYDSQALVPAALKDAVRDWQLPTGKLFTADDYSTDAALWGDERMRAGVTADALCVLELVEAVEAQAQQWEGVARATFSGTAFSVLRARYDLPDMRKAKGWNQLARQAYVGGRVEVLRHAPKGKLWEYDVNSSYPWSMTQRLPLVPLRELTRAQLRRWQSLCGLVLAEVDVPEQPLGPLPWVHPDGGLYFPVGRWSAWFHVAELANAEERFGVRVRPLLARTYEPTSFEGMVSELYELKRTSKGAVREFAKRTLNGAYGKFGQHPEQEVLRVFASVEECAAFIADLPPERLELTAPDRVRPLSSQAVSEAVVRHSPWANYATAGAITAHSRVKLLNYLQTAGVSGCYCDTDSVFTQRQLPKALLHPTDLGMLKLEATLTRARFYAPKLYALDHVELQKVVVNGKETLRHDTYAAKGFPVTAKDFNAVVRGELVQRERIQLLKGQLKSGHAPVRLTEPKSWSGLSSKRCPLPGPTGETRPWAVEELLDDKHLGAVSPLGKRAHRAHNERENE